MSHHAKQMSSLFSLALMLVLLSAAVQAAPASTNQSSSKALFELSEIQGAHIAMNADQKCASATSNANGGVQKGNPVINNKFTEHVCAAHVFHPKRKAMQARERKAAEHQCASKPAQN